jgi:hypothetical protein
MNTSSKLDKIVERTAIELAKYAAKDLTELRASGVDITPLPGETVLGTILRLKYSNES